MELKILEIQHLINASVSKSYNLSDNYTKEVKNKTEDEKIRLTVRLFTTELDNDDLPLNIMIEKEFRVFLRNPIINNKSSLNGRPTDNDICATTSSPIAHYVYKGSCIYEFILESYGPRAKKFIKLFTPNEFGKIEGTLVPGGFEDENGVLRRITHFGVVVK